MDHAILSPSSAGRWLTCTPSARLELQFPDSESDFAREGTLAHLVAEALLKSGHAQLDLASWQKFRLMEFYTEAMYEHVQDFANYVYEHIEVNTIKAFKRWLSVERKLDLSTFVPESFGTSDALLISHRTLHVFDLKYGKGVPVSAVNNKQLMIYALGALEDFGYMFDIDTVVLHIYQPRLNNISTFEISVEGLVAWGEGVLKPNALLAWEGEGEFVPGDHCQFCRARVRCKALADYNLSIVQSMFEEDPALLKDTELLEIYENRTVITNWIKAVSDYALSEALKGKKWPGFKVVEGISKRVYKDEKLIAQLILKNLYISNMHKPHELLNMGDLEKLIGKEGFIKYVVPNLYKPPGAPTLVYESDEREVYNPVAKAFDDGYTEYEEDFMN